MKVAGVLERVGSRDQSAASKPGAELSRRAPPTAAKLLLPVWGYKYVRQFLECSLPTLLAPGNLPAVATALDSEFIILTSADDEDYIREHPGFKHLAQVCKTDIRLIDHLIMDGNHSTTITMAYTEVVRSVGDTLTDTCFFFLVSDYIVAEGSLRSVLERMMLGKSAVVVGNFQVVLEDGAPWLQERLRTAGSSLALKSRELMSWALNHLHPATIANFVNIPLSHNSHTNRLFWRVDASTVLGRFYLMHMICVRPELSDFAIGASCDYSFVPEMCPSGNVAAITDSDDYLVVEMQPRDHEGHFLRPGPLRPKALARSLAEWTTETHRNNARTSLIFHADDIPPDTDEGIRAADAFIESVSRAIKTPPQPYRGHPYWRGATATLLDATGRKIRQEEWQYVLGLPPTSSRINDWLLWELKSRVLGLPPRVFPWHPLWVDYRMVLQALEPFFADQNKRLLMLSNGPTAFTVSLADSGERVHRIRCGAFLKNLPQVYEPLTGRFDLCLLELSESEISQGDVLIDRIVPLMKANGQIIVSVLNRRASDARAFARNASHHGARFVRSGASPVTIQYVPANIVRWGTGRVLGRLRELASRWPLVGTPFLILSAGTLILLSGISNIDRLRRAGDVAPRGICSSLLMLLRVDARRSKDADKYAGHAIRARKSLRASMPVSRASATAHSDASDISSASETTREPQYSRCLDLKERFGLTSLGLMTNQVWYDDPRRLTFLLARYKFVSKMLSGRRSVGEVGCGDAFGTRIVQQEVETVTVYDFDPLFIADVKARQDERWPLKAVLHDIVSGPLPERHDGLFSLDVLEHIPREDEDSYIVNLRDSLNDNGVLIIGSPSLESQTYASPPSKAGHVNCKSGRELKVLLEQYFTRVFLFSMNDEMVHTGFYPMAHYLFAICTGPK